jgi:signal transduction histidine kinase
MPEPRSARSATGSFRDRAQELLVTTPDGPAPIQFAASVVISVVAVLTVQPLGWSGRGLVVGLLLMVNIALLFSRHLPDAFVPVTVRTGLLFSGAVVAAGLTALAAHGVSFLFAFYIAGHAGYRLRTRPATVIAVFTAVLSTGVLLLHLGPGHLNVPWEVGACTGFPVLLGMINRTRQAAFQSALDAAESAERAAGAEAREAVLAERARIARDVHDVLAHSLAGINMQLELADALLDTGDLDRVREATRRAQSLVREGLLESRRTVHALRDEVLPLTDTLRTMLDSSGHPDALQVSGTVRDVETRIVQTLIRIAQEALTNVARHAPGAAVQVVLDYRPTVLTLEICNQPVSPDDSDGHEGSGLGLVGMRERAALLGGTVTVGPITEGPFRGGWRVWASIPG